MRRLKWRNFLFSLLLGSILLITGCQTKAPSPYADIQSQTSQRNAPSAVVQDATQGSQFNQFFPESTDGFERIFSQEKKGFAEAKLKKDGQNVAMLSIFDTVSSPTSAAKYSEVTETLAGYPTVEVGTTQTAILVADRYQVKVLSRDPSFSQQNRQDWIQKFNLTDLAALQ